MELWRREMELGGFDGEPREENGTMGNRERCLTLIDSFTDSQLKQVAEYLQWLKDEAEDDAFCLALHEEAMKDGEPEYISLDDCVKELGLSFD
jgi:hypothetical protein